MENTITATTENVMETTTTTETVTTTETAKPKYTREVYWTAERLENATAKEYLIYELEMQLERYSKNERRLELIAELLDIAKSIQMKSKPKACPICGKKETVTSEQTDKGWVTGCNNTKHPKFCTEAYPTEDEAIISWNSI